MSRVRLAVGGMVVLGALAGSGAVAVAAWPLAPAPRGEGQEPVMAFQPKLDGPGQLKVIDHNGAIDVPAGLSSALTHATIALDLVVDGQGTVTSARPVSFVMRNEGSGLQLSSTDLASLTLMIKAVVAQRPGGRPLSIDAAAVTRDLDAMRQAASDPLTRWQFAAPAAAPAIARVAVSFDLGAGTATAGAPQPISGFAGVANAPMSTFVVRRDAPAADGTIRVGGAIRPPQKVHNVNPVYPQEARDAGVQGIVVIESKIAADGSVAEAWVVKSTAPILDQAALDAVRQWRYTPTLMNGVAVPVIVTATVSFTLK